jgi:lipopolysaccharide/colanic/teichoic acid biosynthesis glycosyltransferase
MYNRFGKRTTDIIIALGAIAVFAIPMGLVAVWVKIDSKGPILFKQFRSGKYGEPFLIYKFRTMSTDAPREMPTNSFENSGSFITASGKIMRKLSLDELPQLFNVLQGKMSIIGPRPVLLKEEKLLTLRQNLGANNISPGITGWAQVHGRDELNDIMKARLDGQYVQQLGFFMDVRCLILTVWTVVAVRGQKEGHERNSKVIVDSKYVAEGTQ